MLVKVITAMHLKIAHLKSKPHHPGDNELTGHWFLAVPCRNTSRLCSPTWGPSCLSAPLRRRTPRSPPRTASVTTRPRNRWSRSRKRSVQSEFTTVMYLLFMYHLGPSLHLTRPCPPWAALLWPHRACLGGRANRVIGLSQQRLSRLLQNYRKTWCVNRWFHRIITKHGSYLDGFIKLSPNMFSNSMVSSNYYKTRFVNLWFRASLQCMRCFYNEVIDMETQVYCISSFSFWYVAIKNIWKRNMSQKR